MRPSSSIFRALTWQRRTSTATAERTMSVHCFLKTRVPQVATSERAAHAQTDQHKVESVVEILLAV